MEQPLARALAAVLDEIAAVPVPAPGDQPVPAAVLVALDARAELEAPAEALGEIRVVLTKRRADLRRHAGEISFPGGRWEPSDSSLYDTAVREVEEEIGLPAAEVSPLGALSVVNTFVTNYAIQPFVGLVERARRAPRVAERGSGAAPRWLTSAQEVDEVLELTLAEIDAGRGSAELERRGIRFSTDTFTVGPHLIWGATFRILEDLLVRLRSAV